MKTYERTLFLLRARRPLYELRVYAVELGLLEVATNLTATLSAMDHALEYHPTDTMIARRVDENGPVE